MRKLLMNEKPTNLITNLLTRRLSDMDTADVPADINEVLRIKAALDADRPTADFILTTIFNELSFLHKEFPLENDEEFAVILRFLTAFHEHTQKELLSKAGTHKDGLTMDLSQENGG